MVHWRRKWQATSVFLLWEPHKQHEKARRCDNRQWAPHLEGVQYATGKEQREITNSFKKNEVIGPKQKWCSVVDMSGGENKVWCYKEQYCIGTWHVRSMNKGKWHVVRQEMARVNIEILGINELKWIGMGNFNLDEFCVSYCGQESLRRNIVALIANKSPKCST